MIVYFADRQLNVLGQASTALPEGLIISDDNKSDEIETGVSVFECKIAYTEETQAKAKAFTAPGNYLLRNNGKESNLYSIVEREIDTKKQEVYIYAEDDGMDLLNEVVGEYEADKAYPITHYINMYAADAGFQIGINEAASLTRKLAWDGESTATARIASVATQFDGCEVSYSFEVDGLHVVKKFINIYKERGKDTGLQLRLNRDIDSIVTKESITNLATALQCTGGTPEGADNPITLKGYKYDDGDFYVDNGVLKSREALKKWARLLWKTDTASKSGGHITKLYSYDTESQATLCSHAITELKKYRDMEVNYETEIPNLPDDVRIGDRVNIIDDVGELYVSARVLQLETSVANEETKVVLGEHLIKTSGIHQKVAELAEQFAKNAYSAARALALANSAKTDAENAQTQAGSALEKSQEAQQAAQNAQNAANSANESASNAQEKAAVAEQAVARVEESVAGLETTVANAQEAAQQAQQAAQTAETKASEARQSAVNAQAKADEAATAAGNAQTKADSATAKADTAKTTAEQAIADAEAAATTAAAAKLDAEQAQKDIDAFGESLTTLENTMTAEYARKTDLTEAEASLQTQISQNAAGISSTATKVQEIDETANNAAEQAQAAQTAAGAAQAQADQAKADANAAQTAADNAAAAAAAAQGEANTAKAAAATAQNVADKAEADLEAAKADLATVTSRVDSTEEEIAAAQQAVEAAQTAANNAKADADAAAKKATDAQSTADTAVTNAANAQSVADEAASKANLAQQTADAAKGDAAAAQRAADEAAETAAEAQRIANTAVSNAATAQAAADKAKQDAETAQRAAEDADAKAAQAATDLATAQQNLANVTSRVDATEEEVAAAQRAVQIAQTAADKAKQDAQTAQSTADTAKANAATAQTAANNAKAAADKAQADATAAQQAADKAQDDVNALAVRVTTAETKITQNSEQIELRATKTEVESINVGSRNLIANTSLDTVYSGSKGSSTYKDVWAARTIDVPTATEYVVSFDAKADAEQSIQCFFYSPNTTLTSESSTGDHRSNVADGVSYVDITTEWNRYWVKWTQNAADAVKSVIVGRTFTDNTVYIRAVKLEEGNRATSWTPAPEDFYTRTETDAKIKVSSDSITSSVSATYATKTALSATDTKAVNAANAAAAAQNDIDNLNIGGRNLLLNTNGTGDIVVDGGTLATAGITQHTNDGILTLTCATESTEIYYRFMSPSSSSNNLYSLKTGETYTFSGKAMITATSGTLVGLVFRSQAYRLGGWSGGIQKAIATANTDDWVDFEYSFTVESDATGYYLSFQINYSGSFAAVAQFKDLKLEHGTRATDWTPAPEDVESGINDAQTAAGEAQNTANNNATSIATAETTIQQLADSIAQLVRDGNGGSLIRQDANGLWYFNIGGIEKNISDTANTLDDLSGVVRNADGEIDVLKTTAAALQERTEYVRSYTDKNGQPCLELGEGDSVFKVRITNTDIQFAEGTATPAKLNRKMLVIEKAMVKNELQFGDDEVVNGVWIWKRRGNGNLGLMWKEVGN